MYLPVVIEAIKNMEQFLDAGKSRWFCLPWAR